MSTAGRSPLLLAALLALLLVAGCNDAEEPVPPTPNVNVRPHGHGLSPRIEVVVVGRLSTPTPAPTATPAASGEEEAAATGPRRHPRKVTAGQAAGSGGGQASDQELVDQGEGIFGEECATCHQADGQGSGSYPALAGSGILTGEDPTQAIQYVLNGPGEMPSFEDNLSNQQIAAVSMRATRGAMTQPRFPWPRCAKCGTAAVRPLGQVPATPVSGTRRHPPVGNVCGPSVAHARGHSHAGAGDRDRQPHLLSPRLKPLPHLKALGRLKTLGRHRPPQRTQQPAARRRRGQCPSCTGHVDARPRRDADLAGHGHRRCAGASGPGPNRPGHAAHRHTHAR
ncbi:MAG: c-type cytochrome [Caldilineaceae bacterium]